MIERGTWYTVGEKVRCYVYPDGGIEQFDNVVRLQVTVNSGHHLLECRDGMKYIVAPGWRYIAIDGQWIGC